MIVDLQGGGVTMDFVISGMCNTEKRREVIDFTQGYLTMKVGILSVTQLIPGALGL